MIRVELGNGKSVLISSEQYFDLLDDDYKWERFLYAARGEEINDPFNNSVIKGGREDFDEELEDEPTFNEDYDDFFDEID